MRRRCRVVVVGGGLSGLTAAYRLQSRFGSLVEIVLLEASARLGGHLRTERPADGWLAECGPDAFIRTKPAGVQLCRDLGIEHELIRPERAHQQAYIATQTGWAAVPDDFHLLVPRRFESLLTTPLLSTGAKLRAIREREIASTGAVDPSLADFTRERWGDEMLTRLVQPLAAGIYSADPERLSLRATMPRFLQLVDEYGSLTAAGRHERTDAKASGARYDLFASFPAGIARLIEALDGATEPVDKRLGTSVRAVKQDNASWVVRTDTGSLAADAVCLATPAAVAARLLSSVRAVAECPLPTITAASSTVVVGGYRRDQFSHPLDAFGFVIPHVLGEAATAISIASNKFPGRAPRGHVLVRTFLGSPSFDAEAASDADCRKVAADVLSRRLGKSGEPLFTLVVPYRDASPLYEIGHASRVRAVDRAIESLPGLALAGASYTGVGIPDAIASATAAASSIAVWLEGSRVAGTR